MRVHNGLLTELRYGIVHNIIYLEYTRTGEKKKNITERGQCAIFILYYNMYDIILSVDRLEPLGK